MNEIETIASLEQLKAEIETEFDVIREKVYEKERSIIGLINGRIQIIASGLDKMMDDLHQEELERQKVKLGEVA